jgi:nucleotide-binding universal stress UspA family protein
VNGSIICGVDDSESAKGAARVARALSRELGLRVVFVRAVDDRADEKEVTTFAERLQRLTAQANSADCGAAWSVELGHPADALVAAAKRAGAAMIVVGSTGPRSSLLGSVSADVSRRAPCPVVVVPPEAAGGVADGRRNGDTPELAGGIARFGLGLRGAER